MYMKQESINVAHNQTDINCSLKVENVQILNDFMKPSAILIKYKYTLFNKT